ncbi:ABC transporter permease [Cytobacillus suaedae]|nr:ABC transporter permease [Cytobacillus suaedae]
MSINQLILRNIKKNIKNYYLYLFALIFSVALYFSFVTLQYDPALDETKGSIKGAASIRAASVLLVAIVSIFLLYANNIFIKRRSQEVGLFQLIGMTKGKIHRILSAENFILYFGSMGIGIFIGFSFSKLIMMIFLSVVGIETNTTLQFSTNAFIQTLIVFSIIYLLIMLMNYFFIRRQTILSLFRVLSSAEGKVKKISIIEVIIGVIGISFITIGYYVSSKLFNGAFTQMNELFLAMLFILTSVILGTYLFFKSSVSIIFNLIRKRKGGYLNIHEVLSISSIMFRMKSNALLLTIITTVSGLAIGLLSLSYISYYSAEASARNSVPSDFTLADSEDAEVFIQELEANNILFSENQIEVIMVNINLEDLMTTKLKELNIDQNAMTMPVISENSIEDIEVSENEAYFTGYNDLLQKFMKLKESGKIEIKGKTKIIQQEYLGLKRDFILSRYFTNGGLPTAIVDEKVFQQLKQDINPEIQKKSYVYIGIDVIDQPQIKKANEVFKQTNFSSSVPHESRLDLINHQKKNMGLIMFIVGFLGLTFLITSGCILYFKQMDESEDEISSFTILRKLGFTQGDLLKGIKVKHILTFGIPLLIGLSHSYFAVQSGWFLFGTELWTPMLIVMLIYTALYSIFGFLSVLYSKKVIKDSL